MPKATVALVTGCFDLLHYGHFKFLKFAKSQADTLIVGLESDDFLKNRKGPARPLFSQKIRKFCLSQVNSVDKIVYIPNHVNYLKLLQKIHPDYLVISSNDAFYQQKKHICQQLGIKLIIFPRLKNYSTTSITTSL
jgi:cytidyltransferase-like protein